jgi:hypothetical protein
MKSIAVEEKPIDYVGRCCQIEYTFEPNYFQTDLTEGKMYPELRGSASSWLASTE